jgi:hypothetical protein
MAGMPGLYSPPYAPYGAAGYPPPGYPPSGYPPPPMPEEEESAGPGGNEWLLWAIPVVAVVLVGAGAVAFLAARSGPSKARATASANAALARNVPPPSAYIPPPKVAVNPGATGGTVTSRVAPPRPSAPRPVTPQVALPAEKELDATLRKMWQAAETNSLKTKQVRTLKSSREGALGVQPVELSMSGKYPDVVAFLVALQDSMPACVPVSLEMANAPKHVSDQPADVPLKMTVKLYFNSDYATPGDDAGDADSGGFPARRPDVAAALADLGRMAGGRVALLSLSLKPEPSRPVSPGAQKITSPSGTLSGFAESDVDVARLLTQMSASPWFKDVNLITSEGAKLGERPLRRFQVEFFLREESVRRAPGAGSKSPQGIYRSVQDPFQLPASFDPAPKPNSTIPSPPALSKAEEGMGRLSGKAEATEAAKGLRVQTILAGSRKACMINNKLLKVGDQVDGFTVEDITAGSVIVRKGDFKFMIVPKQ